MVWAGRDFPTKFLSAFLMKHTSVEVWGFFFSFIWLVSVYSLRGKRDDAFFCNAVFNRGNINRNWKSLFMLTKPENLKAHTCKVVQDSAYSLGLSFCDAWIVLLIWTINSALIVSLCHLRAELTKWKRDWQKFLRILLNLHFSVNWQCLLSFSADPLTSSKSDKL